MSLFKAGLAAALTALLASQSLPVAAEPKLGPQTTAPIVLAGGAGYGGRYLRKHEAERVERRVERRLERRSERRTERQKVRKHLERRQDRKTYLREKYTPRIYSPRRYQPRAEYRPRIVVPRYLPDSRYRAPRYRVGSYLSYRRHRVISDHRRLGLLDPAPGYAWYAVDRDAYLVALGTGLIVKAILF